MTSAPKSDKITAAPGPAMKLAKSTTFSPEKILSFAIESLPAPFAKKVSSPSAESRHALFEEGGRAFILVFGGSAKAEVGSLQQQTFALARFDTFVCRLKCELDGDGGVGGDSLQDRLSARDKIRGRNDLVDESDPISLLGAD